MDHCENVLEFEQAALNMVLYKNVLEFEQAALNMVLYKNVLEFEQAALNMVLYKKKTWNMKWQWDSSKEKYRDNIYFIQTNSCTLFKIHSYLHLKH